MARTRDEKSFQAKRHSILEVAIECFIQSGFHGTGMAKICQAVGMSPGALYRYFPSKESMIEAIAEQERTEIAPFLAKLEQAENKAEGLADLMVAIVRMLAADRSYCQLSVEISAEAARNPAIAQLLSDSDARLMQALVTAVEQGQAKGQIDPQLDATVTAQLLMVMMDGSVGRLSIDNDWDAEAIAQQTRHSMLKILTP